jgi:hypothetical protein
MANEIAEIAQSEDVTATPEVEIIESPVEAEAEAEVVEKSFTQAELDAVVTKRLAREQRKWERERHDTETAKPVMRDVKPENFETHESYIDALAEQKAEKILSERKVKAEQSAIAETYAEKEELVREKHADYQDVVYNPKLRITNEMAETIRMSDNGPDIAYFLGTNEKEAERISKLSPLAQAREIGKIENKLATAPAVTKKLSSAPAPISPISSRNSKEVNYDTTDPRSVKSMTTSEWIEAERKRQTKKLKG